MAGETKNVRVELRAPLCVNIEVPADWSEDDIFDMVGNIPFSEWIVMEDIDLVPAVEPLVDGEVIDYHWSPEGFRDADGALTPR